MSTTTEPTTTAPLPTQQTLRISTRSSALALAQVDLFTTLLHTHPSLPPTPTTTHPIATSLGDTNKTTALAALASSSGGKSLWTEDLEAELLAGRVDVIVHSLKDVPTKLARGCVCSAVGAREEGRDCVVLGRRWVGKEEEGGEGGGEGGGGEENDEGSKGGHKGVSGLDALPAGAVIGTSSVRRAAMLRRRFPHLVVKDMRGNVPTRLRKIDDPSLGFDAAVVAGAGVQRLGLEGRISGWLDRRSGVLHAVGQGAIGVEWREGDEWVGGIVEALTGRGRRERRVRWEGCAERELLRVLEGGCSVPVGVDCVWEEREGVGEELDAGNERGSEEDIEEGQAKKEVGDGGKHGGMLVMQAMVVSVDGKECVEGTRRHWVSSDADAEECGWRMAQELVEKGAGEILKEITLNRDIIKAQDGA